MKLLFKQRFFSWFDSYDIYNEAGETVYTVEGNSGDACKIKSYSLSYECIKGYGLMNW